MATRFSTTLVPSNDTDAHFRANAQFVEDTLVTTGGWVVTADTGQTLPSALLHPTGAPQSMGYRIYRMNDALQATAPLFMRIDFGSSVLGANVFMMTFTYGTGSNGAGGITGVLYSNSKVTNGAGNFSSNTLVTNSYGSADPGRAAIGLFIQGTENKAPIVWCIERSKDPLGNDTADGILLIFMLELDIQAAVTRTRYLQFNSPVQPGMEAGLSYVLSNQNPSQTFGGAIGMGVITHFRGIAQQPALSLVVVNANDISSEGSFSLTLYNTTRHYQHLGIMRASAANVSSFNADFNSRIAILYE